MMNWLGFITLSAICGGLCIFLGRVVFSGLQSGRIAHTDSSSFCKRQENPLGYWALVIFFSAIILGCLFILGRMTYEAFAV
jgi:hypothetical protein